MLTTPSRWRVTTYATFPLMGKRNKKCFTRPELLELLELKVPIGKSVLSVTIFLISSNIGAAKNTDSQILFTVTCLHQRDPVL